MKTLLILIIIEIILNWTNIHIGCLGLPIQDRNEDDGKSSRLTRSLHALHSQLCPEGSSSESCFYSQLSMFMRMQDSLMDPVALRNIGKRSKPDQFNNRHAHNIDNTNTMLDMDFETLPNDKAEKDLHLPVLETFVNMLNELKAIVNGRDINSGGHGLKNPKSEYLFVDPVDFDKEIADVNIYNSPEDSSPSLDNIMEHIGGETDTKFGSYLGLENDQKNTNRVQESPMENYSNNRKTPVRKRQIICPPGVSRLNCYDNALAFYMRLLKTLNH